MIAKHRFYSLSCDHCGAELKHPYKDTNLFEDEEDMKELASDEGWMPQGRGHLCPRCYWGFIDNLKNGWK